MDAIEWITLGLAVLTGIYVWLVFMQAKRLKELTLKQTRYQVEGDITQIRITKAQVIKDKAEAWKILEEREKQCKETVDRIEIELQSSFLKRTKQRKEASNG